MLGGNPIDQLMDLVNKGDIQQAGKAAELVDEIVAKASYVHKKDLASFYLIFPLLLDRLFGEEVAGISPVAMNTSSTSGGNAGGAGSSSGSSVPASGLQWTKGQFGGWLFQILQLLGNQYQSASRYGQYSRYGNSYSTSAALPRTGLTLEAQSEGLFRSLENYGKLIKILYPFSMIFAVLEKLQHSYELKTSILPSKLQMYITNHPLYVCVQSDHHERLFSLLSKTTINDIAQRREIQGRLRMRLDAIDYFLICLVRYPTVYNNCLSKSTSSSDGHFSRSLTKTSSDILRDSGCLAWVQGVPYLVTLLEYFNDILLSKSKGNINGLASTPGGSFVVVQERDVVKQRLKELLVLLAIDYWIDTGMILHYNQYMAPIYRKMVNSVVTGGIPLSDENLAKPHPDPTEVVMLDPNNCRWTVSSCQCTYLLLWTVLRDSETLREYLGTRGEEFVAHAGIRFNNRLSAPAHPWAMLQQPIFDMLRCIFSRGDQPQIDREVLELAVDIWLLWIQPWTAHVGTAQHVVLDGAWLNYIAHNLHFYATLLPSFLKMISKMNISPLDGEGERNLKMLGRVLKVFSPVLVEIVKGSSTTFASWYDGILDGRIPLGASMRTPLKAGQSTSGSMSPSPLDTEIDGIPVTRLHLMKEQHEKFFPDIRIAELPDRGITKITDYSLDSVAVIIRCIDRLQKEVKEVPSNPLAQYLSDIGSVLGFSDDAAAVQAQKLQNHPMLNNCRELLYKLIPAAEIRKKIEEDIAANRGLHFDESRIVQATRDPITGKITKRGKDMVDAKVAKFDAKELDASLCFRGDPLDLPCCSFEHPRVLKFVNKVAKYLNSEYFLPRDRQYVRCSWYAAYDEMVKTNPSTSLFHVMRSCFRFNFRFLAQYRVIGTILLLIAGALHRYAGLALIAIAPLLIWSLFLLYEGAFTIKLKKKPHLKPTS